MLVHRCVGLLIASYMHLRKPSLLKCRVHHLSLHLFQQGRLTLLLDVTSRHRSHDLCGEVKESSLSLNQASPLSSVVPAAAPHALP